MLRLKEAIRNVRHLLITILQPAIVSRSGLEPAHDKTCIQQEYRIQPQQVFRISA